MLTSTWVQEVRLEIFSSWTMLEVDEELVVLYHLTQRLTRFGSVVSTRVFHHAGHKVDLIVCALTQGNVDVYVVGVAFADYFTL